MAFELFLVRFDGDGLKSADTHLVLEQLRRTALAIVPADDPYCEVGEIEPDHIDIELRDGQVNVRADCVTFRLQQLRSDMIPLIYELAKAGDMTIVYEGGSPHVVLTDPRQSERMPPNWCEANPPVCRSAQDLESLFASSIAGYSQMRPAPATSCNEWSHQH